jgi:hypothetical protein
MLRNENKSYIQQFCSNSLAITGVAARKLHCPEITGVTWLITWGAGVFSGRYT